MVYGILDEVRQSRAACWLIFPDATRMLLRYVRSEDWREGWYLDPLGERHVYAVYSPTAQVWDELSEGQLLPLIRTRGHIKVEVADAY